MNLFLLPLLSLLQKTNGFTYFYTVQHIYKISQLKHFSVSFSCFLLIDLYIESFQSMKYFHEQLYHTFQSQRTLHHLKLQKCSEII